MKENQTTHKTKKNVSNILILMWLRNDAVGNWYNDTLIYRRCLNGNTHTKLLSGIVCLAHRNNDSIVMWQTTNSTKSNTKWRIGYYFLFQIMWHIDWIGNIFQSIPLVKIQRKKNTELTKWCVFFREIFNQQIVFDTPITMIACFSYKNYLITLKISK